MKRILISGVAGFLGVNLALKLLEDENNLVYGVDDFSCSSISNLYRILKNERFNFLQQNISDRITVNVDEIYHFAGCGDLCKYYDNKYLYCCDSIKNINSILDYAYFSGAKILFTSGFIDKNFKLNDLNLYYKFQKFINELILEYSNFKKIDIKIAQIDKIYGQNVVFFDKRFIPDTIIKSFNNENIILDYNYGHYYTFCEDTVCGFIKIMNNYLDEKIIDVAFPNISYDFDIAKLIVNFTKSKSKIIVKNNIQIDPIFTPNIDILNSKLDFRCKTPVLEGISKTIDFIKLMYFT